MDKEEITDLSWKAYDHACEKHPESWTGLIDTREIKWKDSEAAIKRRCDTHVTADNVAMEELAETFSAIEAGNYEQAIHEAYDTIAVMFRLIEMLEAMKEAEDGKPGDKAQVQGGQTVEAGEGSAGQPAQARRDGDVP